MLYTQNLDRVEGKDETIDQPIDIKWFPRLWCFLSVRFENCSTKSA